MADNFKVVGVKQVNKALEKSVDRIIDAELKGAKKGIIIIQNEAKNNLRKARRDTGRTMNQTRGKARRTKEDKVVGLLISRNGIVSFVTEFGSGRFAENNKGRKTKWFVSSEFLKASTKWKSRFPNGFLTSGVKGIKFMRNAVDAKKPRYVKEIAKAVRESKVTK